MRNRFSASFGLLASLIVVSSSRTAAAEPPAQNVKATAARAATPPPRTSWGTPDLTGVWTGSTITPLERPRELAGREFLSEAEAAALEKRSIESQVDRPPQAGDPGTYNQIWFDPSSK